MESRRSDVFAAKKGAIKKLPATKFFLEMLIRALCSGRCVSLFQVRF